MMHCAKVSRARTLAVAFGLALTGAVVAATPLAGAAPKPSSNATRVAPIGTYAVGKVDATFVDPSRPTNANGSYGGADSRSLFTTVYYPAKGAPASEGTDIVPKEGAAPNTKNGPFPFIIFSHGALARGIIYESEAEAWASAGYVVAAPDFPLSNTNAEGGATLAGAVGDVENQPADDSFVINQVLALNQDEANPLYRMIDPKRIGAAGHSNGAITTYGLVYSECCNDERIRAAIAMSGLAGLVDDEYFQGENVPLLILHGDADPLVPYSAATTAYRNAKAPKFLLTFIGAGHVQPFVGGTGAQGDALFSSTTDFWDRYLKGDRGALAELRRDADVPGETMFQEDTGSARTGG